ncbi:PREDICTED: centrosome-associated protein 350-like [Thamnophis sirtalis]|uniref:Centrosome-associated protein 350-like n=1 Tax=Thamnophis sirtalis TaxID=35019 RepID=A0A6I9XZ90_9SAUR|nr:PREDICTED: centrosome-associated protein 350-like [Thamnophis sirtalis]
MCSKKASEFPLHNPKFSQNRNSIRDLTTAWNSVSQAKATLQHIENKLEADLISTAGLDTVMEKKPSISTTRKISRKGCRSSSQNKESSSRRPLRATTLDSNVSKNGHVELHQPLSSFRDSRWSPSYKTSCQLEARRLKYKETGNKAERSGMIYDKGESDLHGRDLKRSSSTDETIVRYLNDRPAINALQNSDVVNHTKLEEKSEESRGDEYTKTSSSSIIQNELKEFPLVESSASSASTSSAHRLDILKQHQHDDKLEKLKEQIRKQWEFSEELIGRGYNPEHSDHPITITAPENIVTPKIRKVATAPMAPSYKGFNPSEAKIRTPDGKVWCEEEFLNLNRDLCQDFEFQLAEEDLTAIKTPTERKEKKGHKTVRKTQKIAQLSSPKSGAFYCIFCYVNFEKALEMRLISDCAMLIFCNAFLKAEIKRLQEAYKAARKERHLILKQQEEIKRIRQTTMKLQEKLKFAGENKEHRSEEDKKQTHSSSPQLSDAEAYSPSSISSSETSSIMQKLKKMRRRMDEKFLTKREQKLMQRRQYAEELLQWKQRLDAEEAEIRQIEKQAQAAWEKELPRIKANKKGAGDQKSDPKDAASEEDSPMPPCSHLNSKSSVPEELSNLVVESIPSKVSEIKDEPGSLDHTITEEIVYTEEPKSLVSTGKPSPCKSSASLSKQESNKQTQKSLGKQLSSTKSQDISYSWSDESLSMTQSETTSDQSDIESRIWALKDQVRKKKSVVYRLKKEQKKRLKEKLKAQEASLIKQLETYDEFIKKTEEELNRDLETTPTAKPQIKTPTSVPEKPKIKPPPLHRSETSKSWKSLTDSERSRGSLESIAEHIDAVSHFEQSVSINIMKFTEEEIHEGKQSHTASRVLKTRRKSIAESDDLDSVLSSSILKDLENTSKISPISMNKPEDAVSYDSPAIVQETAESKELEVEIVSQAYEISNAPVFDLNQNNSSPLKKEVPPETELLEKDQFVLECKSVQEIKEMPSETFEDDENITSVKSTDRLGKDTLKDDSLVSEQISICEEQSYSSDFEESSLGTDISKSEIVLTEYQRDIFQEPTLSFRQDAGSQAENSLYTRPPRGESPGFGSDDEISECLSEKSLSVVGSIQSERLLELQSPTEFVKNKECGDVEKEPPDDDDDDDSSWASSGEQEDILLGFNIGDRVLVSNLHLGTLKFKGRTNFDTGFWAGVELDKPDGYNNGSFNDIQYFDCKEKHGIFAPPQNLSLFSESVGNNLDSNENSFFKRELDNQPKTNQGGLDGLEKEKNERNSNEKSPKDSSALKSSIGAGDYINFNKSRSCVVVISPDDEFDQETSDFDSLKSSKNDNGMLPPAISNIHKENSAIEVGGIVDNSFPEKWKQQSVWQEQTENRFSSSNLEKSATPLLDLLTKERSQLEAQLKVPSQEKEDVLDRQERVGLLADSLLQGFVKDTVNQFQQIKKARNEKIHFSNQELGAVQEKNLAFNEQQRFLVASELDDGEEVSSPDMCPRPESPVFGASGQEELAKRLAELELSREYLNVLGDDQDWSDEDFGLSSHQLPENQAEESEVLPKIEVPKVSQKPCEEPLDALYVAEEVEKLVHAATEKLWKCKELGHDLRSLSSHRDMNESTQDDDIETINKQISKQLVFDLTREIFEEIFSEDPNLNRPLWMKPRRIISGYYRRVRDPRNLEEIKVFITAEVLKLLNLRNESNNKTDWQKTMKFGRKKKDRVDQILVQELYEEEAQWVNYDEDELYVKMQLADGIFEALIRDTIDVLNRIYEKKKLLIVERQNPPQN